MQNNNIVTLVTDKKSPSMLDVLVELDEIQQAFQSLELIASDTDYTEAKHLGIILRQLNKNLERELEKAHASFKSL
jgi:hypothetical protein